MGNDNNNMRLANLHNKVRYCWLLLLVVVMDELYSLGHFKFVSDAVLNFYLITLNTVSKAN